MRFSDMAMFSGQSSPPTQVSDPLALLGGKFSSTIGEVFARVTPTWNEWDAVFDLAARLESAGSQRLLPARSALVAGGSVSFLFAHFIRPRCSPLANDRLLLAAHSWPPFVCRPPLA